MTKKATLRARLEYAETRLNEERAGREAASGASQELSEQVRRLTAEVENMRAHWRPVPITHEWQPKNPQCALCDEPRDSARHQVRGRRGGRGHLQDLRTSRRRAPLRGAAPGVREVPGPHLPGRPGRRTLSRAALVTDIVAFIRARLDEDEQVARAAPGPQWDGGDGCLGVAGGRDLVWGEHTEGFVDVEASAHIARHDPARVLREVEAKREMADDHRSDVHGECSNCRHRDGLDRNQSWPCQTVRLLAQPYAEHPNYRAEWAPTRR